MLSTPSRVRGATSTSWTPPLLPWRSRGRGQAPPGAAEGAPRRTPWTCSSRVAVGGAAAGSGGGGGGAGAIGRIKSAWTVSGSAEKSYWCLAAVTSPPLSRFGDADTRASRSRTSCSSSARPALAMRGGGAGSGGSTYGGLRGRSCGMNSLRSPSVHVSSSGRSMPRPGIAVENDSVAPLQSSPVDCTTTAAVSTRSWPRAAA